MGGAQKKEKEQNNETGCPCVFFFCFSFFLCPPPPGPSWPLKGPPYSSETLKASLQNSLTWARYHFHNGLPFICYFLKAPCTTNSQKMQQVLDIAAKCSTRHGHTHIGILLRYNYYTIFCEDIRVPDIMFEDL